MSSQKIKINSQQGFSLIEFIIVFVLIGIITAFATPVLLRSFVENELKNSQFRVVDDLRRAQAFSMFKRRNKQWGVHFATNSFTFFEGATYNPTDPDNEVTNLSPTITLTGITINGGGADIVFNKVYGDTSNYGTIILTEANTSTTRSVTVNEVGMVDY